MQAKYWSCIIIGILFLGSLLGGISAQGVETPGSTVTDFYDWYLDYITGSGTFRNPLVDGVYRDSEHLTQGLIERVDEHLANAGDMGIGYDLFLCAQDIPAQYRYEVVDTQSDVATVLLREYFGSPRTNNVTLLLNNVEGTWKIDEVTCGDTLTPRGVTENFYTWYLEQWRMAHTTANASNPLMDGLYREYRFLTEAMIARVDEEIANREIGSGDPFLCAQDIPQYFWAQDVGTAGDEATVMVEAFFQGNPIPHNLVVSLAKADNQWYIAEISCGASAEIIAELLYNTYARQVRYNLDNNIESSLHQLGAPWNRYVSPALLDRLAAELEGERIADPVLCAQDIPEYFTTEKIAETDTTATVQVSGLYPSGPGAYTAYPLTMVTMENMDGRWTLTEITCTR